MHPLAQASDAEFIAGLGLDGQDLAAGGAWATKPGPDLRQLGDLLGEIPDGRQRRAILARLVRNHGLKAVKEMLTKILRGRGLPDPEAQAARMLRFAEAGTPLNRTSGGGLMTVDMRRARGVALDLGAMEPAQARAVLNRRKAKVGAERFAAEARLLAASLRTGPPPRTAGDVRTVTDVAAQVPRRAAPANPNDPAYAAVLAQSGVRTGADRFPNADAARRNSQSGW